MIFNLVIFVLSMLVVIVIALLLYKLQLAAANNPRLKGLRCLTIATLAWTFLSATELVAAPEYFEFVFLLKMTCVCLVPYMSFWVILNFTGRSKKGSEQKKNGRSSRLKHCVKTVLTPWARGRCRLCTSRGWRLPTLWGCHSASI